MGVIQQSSIRVECCQLHPRLWLGLGFQRGRPTLDRSLGHDRSLGYNGVPARPFASGNVIRKTGHANQNNWHIAIFDDPLCQQAAPIPTPLGFRVSRFSSSHARKKCLNQVPGANRPVVLEL